MKAIPSLLFFYVALSRILSAGETVVTTDGKTYTDATIFNISPTSIELRTEASHAFVPLRKLPEAIRARYAYDAEELAKHVQGGIDGIYQYREGIMAFAGEIITLKGKTFTYETFSDTRSDSKPLTGTFTLDGHWLNLRNSKIQFPSRVLAVVGGRLALMRTYDYVRLKDGDERVGSEILYRKKSE